MNAVVQPLIGEQEFFAPASSDLVDGLIGKYRSMRQRIEQVAEIINGGDYRGTIEYFIDGNREDRSNIPSVERLFRPEGAIAALNAACWSEALALTDVYDCMPQNRRDEWNEQIRSKTTPDFDEDVVRPTLQALLNSRAKFFAERVDGIFRALSGEHVTNSPAAFGKRMIIAWMLTSYGTVNHDRCGYINDLRCVIAKFMGRDEPGYGASACLIDQLRSKWGEWQEVDGGALRVRLYKKGTAHMEVHPDIAWRLNEVLATLYPQAIPAKFRTKPAKKLKEFRMMGRPLPFAVLAVLGGLKEARDRNPNRGYRDDVFIRVQGCYDLCPGTDKPKQVVKEAESVLKALGGAQVSMFRWAFDYDPLPVLREIVASGCIPDQKSHQFYPTPEKLARIACEMAEIGSDHRCLEPSAGMGGLADAMGEHGCQKITCIEISEIHCKVLESKGYYTIQADFLKWSGETFDRIVMNPPFSEGRWQAHIQHAASLLADGGRLVAILPASAKGKDVLPGFDLHWSPVYDNEFAGTSVSVVILKAGKAA